MVQSSEIHYEKLLYDRASSALKVHGILAIIFGGLGVLFGLVFIVLMAFGNISDPSYDAYSSSLGILFLSALVVVFWILPHAYLITSGMYLIHEPSPKLARTLVIINLVVGVFYNLIMLVAAIVNLTQITDYERAYLVHKKK